MCVRYSMGWFENGINGERVFREGQVGSALHATDNVGPTICVIQKFEVNTSSEDCKQASRESGHCRVTKASFEVPGLAEG